MADQVKDLKVTKKLDINNRQGRQKVSFTSYP